MIAAQGRQSPPGYSTLTKVKGDSGRAIPVKKTFIPSTNSNGASFKYKIVQRSLLCFSLKTIGLLSMVSPRKMLSIEWRKGNTDKHNRIFYFFSTFLQLPKWYLVFMWQRTEPNSLSLFFYPQEKWTHKDSSCRDSSFSMYQ